MARIERQERNTVFAFGEGECENIFLKHLKAHYSEDHTYVTVKDAGGKAGSQYVIEKALRVRACQDANNSCILWDSDTLNQDARDKAKVNSFKSIESEPCLEGLFLDILGERDIPDQSKECKKIFRSRYLKHDKPFSKLDCDRLFPKSILDLASQRVEKLRDLIDIMKGCSI